MSGTSLLWEENCCCPHVVICEDGKTKIQAVMKYFVKKSMKANEIHTEVQNTLWGTQYNTRDELIRALSEVAILSKEASV